MFISPVTAQCHDGVKWSGVDRFIAVATQQVGTRETGQNRGAVEKYQKSAGIALGSPYCYAGLYWCSLQADKNSPFLRTGLASLGRKHLAAKAVGGMTLRRGLLFWQFPDNAFGHVDLITEVQLGGWVKCIGFNTGGGGTFRDGGGVSVVRRNINHPLGKMRMKQIIGFQ